MNYSICNNNRKITEKLNKNKRRKVSRKNEKMPITKENSCSFHIFLCHCCYTERERKKFPFLWVSRKWKWKNAKKNFFFFSTRIVGNYLQRTKGFCDVPFVEINRIFNFNLKCFSLARFCHFLREKKNSIFGEKKKMKAFSEK